MRTVSFLSSAAFFTATTLAFAASPVKADRTVSGAESVADMNEAETAPNPEIPSALPARFTARGTLGATASNGSAYSTNTAGGSATVAGGLYVTPRWMAGLFYRDSVSTTADMGLLGGGVYGSTTWGLESDYALLFTDRNEIRLGAKAGRLSVRGVGAVMFLPTYMAETKTWAFGPSLSYYHFFGTNWALGLESSYLQALGSTASVNGPYVNASSTRVPSFGVLDVALGLQIRFR